MFAVSTANLSQEYDPSEVISRLQIIHQLMVANNDEAFSLTTFDHTRSNAPSAQHSATVPPSCIVLG
jgi:hypothetical protein